MTEYWLASENAAEVFLCNVRVKKNVEDQFQLQTTETNNNIVQQPPLDNNTVSHAFLTGVGGEICDAETGQQNMDADDYRFMFDIDQLDFIYDPQQPPMLPQDSILPLGGQDFRSTVDQDTEVCAEELGNKLDKKEDEDDDRAIQQQHSHIPLPAQVQDSGKPHVIMEGESVGLGSVTQQREQERMTEEMQSNRYFQDSYFAGDQQMSPWDNTMTNNNPFGLLFNTLGYETQEPPVAKRANQMSPGFGANCGKRRKQC
ncbi:hypothetical protein CARUB_v10011825mg [Capsella rubella]|uniref:Uncharacterized protein n=1 Tax=Capsella rubella TaxID=81985 RepID=R0GLG8_9BRAS|nr:uncharacterized protein LOC17900305 [Capsella rubella]EOA36611.1 hypothetical protein CARUB_v10011825mg [Capsella rubella]